jgi:hypothetical protein
LSQPELPPLAVGQLEHAWLASVAFQENRDFEFAYEKLTYRVVLDHTVRYGEGEFANTAILDVSAMIEWRPVEGEEEVEVEVEAPFSLSLGVGGWFAWQQSHERESVERWLEYNGVYLLWPYLRSYVSIITSASSVPPLTIYTMRVPDPPHIEDDPPAGARKQREARQRANRSAATRRKRT